MNAKRLQNKNYIVYALSFMLPVIITVIAFFQQGIYPGGTNNILIYDMRGELLPLYGYLSVHGPGYDTLYHWMSGGLGGGFIGSLAMYISFFDIIFFFVPIKYIPDAILFLTIFKIGLCGLFFSFFISSTFQNKLTKSVIVLFSCCYALMSYVLAYSMLLIWLDGVMLLPLLALYAEKIISGKKSIAFLILLSLSILNDYYISFMISIALALYVFVRLCDHNVNPKIMFKRMVVLLTHGVMAVGISSIILVPTIMDLFRGKLSDGVNMSGLNIKNSFMDVVNMFWPGNYSNLGSNQAPYIYCGSIIIILAMAWLLVGKSRVKARVASFGIIIFCFVSFIFGPVDRIWHGFKDPIGFSCRYSFTFVFFMIFFAAEGYVVFCELKISISKNLLKMLTGIVIVYTFIELIINSSLIVSKLMVDYSYANRDEYIRICESVESCLAYIDIYDVEAYSRLAKNFNYSCSDGALFGYDGLEMFTSSYNNSLVELLRNLGLNSSNNFIKESGLTPPVMNILNIGYFMSYWYDLSYYYEPVGIYGAFSVYDNNNALPFAYLISDGNTYRAFNGNPFANINAVYSDIVGDDISVFTESDFSINNDIVEETYITFIPSRDGHYWIYPQLKLYTDADSDHLPNDLTYISCYVDGIFAGNCGFYDYRYCADLGYLNAGQEYTIILSAPSDFIGDIYIDYYNDELCSSICGEINGFKLEEINSNGILLSGSVESEADLLVTLPFEPGYRVYVNGEKYKYDSYRGALMLLHLNAGNNDIRITYVPDGIVVGIVISIVFIMLSCIYFRKSLLKKTENHIVQ